MDGQTYPAAGLHLIRVESPEFEFLFKERPAHVRRIVELARPVIVENLRKHPGVTVEEVFVEDGVVVDESLGEPRQPSGRDLFERLLYRKLLIYINK